MSIISIPEKEYLQIKHTLADLLNKIEYFDREIQKLKMAKSLDKRKRSISLERGSAKSIITYIADDFDAPLEDFKDYM